MAMAEIFRTCPDTGLKVHSQAEALIKANAVVAVVFLAVGGFFGLLVALTRWPAVHLLPADWFYLVLTAALGPIMIVQYADARNAAESAKQQKVGTLQQAVTDGFEINLEPMKPMDVAKTNSHAILALSARMNSQAPIDAIKGGPHSHGNLEALLNIAVGIVLAFLAIPTVFKQVISWVFIAGALLHSGLLYLAIGLELPWAASLLGSPAGYLGPSLILIGLLLAGVAAVMGFKGQIVTD